MRDFEKSGERAPPRASFVTRVVQPQRLYIINNTHPSSRVPLESSAVAETDATRGGSSGSAHCLLLNLAPVPPTRSEVYLAEDTKLDRKVALKVLPKELAENEERRARFQREAKAIAALNHPTSCSQLRSRLGT